MKIALVTAFPVDPGAPHGGVESVCVNLVTALSRSHDLELHVITVDRDCRTVAVSRWNGITVHRLPQLQRHTLLNVARRGRLQMADYLARLAPDVVHAHDSYGIMTRGLPVPRVFTIHGFIHVDTSLEGGRFARLRSHVWRRLETAAWAEQPHVISISPYVRERLTGIATGTIHDIDNPVAEAFFRCERRENRATIFSAAHISRLKNTLGLLKGFARLVAGGCQAELRLAGTASDTGYEQDVREFVSDHALGGQVCFLGRLTACQIREELARASVFALASLQENAPMGIAEAMAVGVPVVTSNRCGMPYMVRDGQTGFLINPNDPADVAGRLRQLLGDDDLRGKMGKKARQIALDRFHPDMVARRTREVYRRALQDEHERNG